MIRISFIHVGDIHYPDQKTVVPIDIRDRGLSPDFTASLAPFRIKRSMDTLLRVIETTVDIRGILFSGDLTSRADAAGYEECVAYLEANLSGKAVWAEPLLHVVPGNHDVDRNADTSVDKLARYRATQDAWTKRSLSVLLPDQVRSTEIREGKAVAWLHSINSCIGCGEIRRLPEKVRTEIAALVARLGVAPISSADFALIGEQLDTPAFDEAHVNELSARIADGGETVHVLLGHHPILPQAIPRVEIYTEAINAGLIRSTLTDLSATVLYCHGHVHDDPIEIVRNAEDGTEVVFVSAPLFTDGFNVLTFHFAPDRRSVQNPAVPLGCEIVRYRSRRNGNLKPDAPIRIQLCGLTDFDYIADDLHSAILAVLTNEPVRFRPLLDEVRQAQGQIQTPRFAEHLTHLQWLGLVDIVGLTEDAEHWQIRRIGA